MKTKKQAIDEFLYPDSGNIGQTLLIIMASSSAFVILMIYVVCQFANSIDDVLK